MDLFKSKTPDRKSILIHIIMAIPLLVTIIYSVWRLYIWETVSYDPFDVMGAFMSNLGMILCALLILILWSDTCATISTKFFQLLTYEVFFLLFFNTMYFLDIGDFQSLDLQTVVICLRSAMEAVILFTFWIYLEDITKSRNGFSLVLERVMFLLMLAHFVMLIINLSTGVFYTIRLDGVKIKTDLYLLMLIFIVCMVLLCWYEILIRFSTRRQIVAMSVFLFLPVIGHLFDMFIEIGMRFVFFAIALFIIYCNLYVWRVDEILDVESEMKVQSTEALLSQIKPHFLYNSLTSIMNIPGTPMETRDVIADFGKYLRGNIDSLVHTAPIPFRREMDSTELFLKMQKLEYGDKLKLKLDLKTQDFMLPVMTLRTLTSLCIQYGIAPKGYGTIFISTKETSTAYEVRIADDGVGYTGADSDPYLIYHEDVVGYHSVKKGLREMMNASITYYSVKGHGTAFNIRVPKVRKAPDVPAYMRQRGSH